jgi:hypothetical protein
MSAFAQILAAAEPTALSSAWIAPTIVLSILALVVSVATFFVAGRRARLDRQRQLFGDAFAAVMAYREYPFIIRRRNPDEVTKERQRISADLSDLQAKLNGFKGMLRVEDPYVGERYVELVDATRRVAGALIKEAWNTDPVGEDHLVHNPSWDFSELDKYDEAYLRAVADHLAWMYTPLRRKVRGWRPEGPASVEAKQPVPGDGRSFGGS